MAAAGDMILIYSVWYGFIHDDVCILINGIHSHIIR